MSLCQQALILAYMCVLLISSCNSGGAQVCAMYGFGDTSQSLPQSVALMEDLVVDYIHQTLQRAHAVSEERLRGVKRAGESKIKERDLLFVLRKDPRRRRRVEELLEVYQTNKEDAMQERPDYANDD